VASTARHDGQVDNQSPEEARLAFSDAYCLWRLEPNVVADLIDAATGCLVAGLDTPLLCELAGVSPRESAFVLAPLADGAIDELGLRESIADNVDQAALATMLRRVVTGRMIPSELTRWAHQHIGHEGDPRCQVSSTSTTGTTSLSTPESPSRTSTATPSRRPSDRSHVTTAAPAVPVLAAERAVATAQTVNLRPRAATGQTTASGSSCRPVGPIWVSVFISGQTPQS
jgi:hypothetical protein